MFAASTARTTHTGPRDTRGTLPAPLGTGDATAAIAMATTSDAFMRRVVKEGEVIYRAGERFDRLYVLETGSCKLVNLAMDGREQVVSFKFRGDWIGLDGIGGGRHTCDAVALDTCAVWSARYDAVMADSRANPALLDSLLGGMSRAIAGDRNALMSVCTLPADARVAEFLRFWVDALRVRGLRCDQITLHLTRAEIGAFLGVTLETVSRALNKLARANIIQFTSVRRREVRIPDARALDAFVQDSLAMAMN